MNRLGLIDSTALTSDQKELYDVFDAYTKEKYGPRFTYKLHSGQFVGPFAVQLHTPEVGHHFLGLTKAISKIPGLSSQAREMAIVVVSVRTQAAYENYAHARLSGFSKVELKEISRGVFPSSLAGQKDLEVAFQVASDLGKPGPLPVNTWKSAVETLGVQGATALVQYVAFYNYVATVLNGFDVQIPE